MTALPFDREGLMEYQPMATNTPSDDLVRGYLDCAEWCGPNDEDREAMELAVSPQWSDEALAHAEDICQDFISAFGPQYDDMTAKEEYRTGMDIWLTRNRHGAGFWDGNWAEPFAKDATDWSHAHGDAYVTFDEETETLEIEGE